MFVLTAEPKMCSKGCLEGHGHPEGTYTCFYRLKSECGRDEFVCRESRITFCEPVFKDIGTDEYREEGPSNSKPYSYNYGYSR